MTARRKKKRVLRWVLGFIFVSVLAICLTTPDDLPEALSENKAVLAVYDAKNNVKIRFLSRAPDIFAAEKKQKDGSGYADKDRAALEELITKKGTQP